MSQIETIRNLSEDLECYDTGKSVTHKDACETCPACLVYEFVRMAEDRPTPRPLPTRGKVDKATLESAIDRLDKLLEDLYKGVEEWTVQNYQTAQTAMEIIRAGFVAKKD